MRFWKTKKLKLFFYTKCGVSLCWGFSLDLHIALNDCLTCYTCALSSSHLTLFFLFSSLFPMPHFLHPSFSWSHFTLHSTPSWLPRAFTYSVHVSWPLSLCFMCHLLLLSLCPPLSLFSASLCFDHWFCSIVYSVWGWTRTPPWPPVRGERLSGTKTSFAPLFSPSSYLVIKR